MTIFHNRMLTKRAQDMRSNGTSQERRLWYCFLRDYPVQVRRQVTVEHFIVDFYCAEAKLVIEIDGGQHYEEPGLEYDKERTAVLEGLGLKVIRFANNEVNEKFNEVCEEIDRVIKERIEDKENLQ